MTDVLKEYLVSLGFDVDKNSANQAKAAMDSMEQGITKIAATSVKQFAIASTAVTGFFVSVGAGIAKFIGDLGKAGIQNEIFARQMWTTQNSAWALNNTLKAMHVSLQDLYLSPTLMSQFMQLRQQAVNMAAPSEYQAQLKMVQSIAFEFIRMKLEATYALQWIGYYFMKYMAGPMLQIKLSLQNINDSITKTMPSWTRYIAMIMVWFAQMGSTVIRVFQDIGKGIKDISDLIPAKVKVIGGAIAALGLIISSGPVGIMIALLTSGIILLQDFYTYIDGGKSALGSFWQKLINIYNSLKSSGAIDAFKRNILNGINVVCERFDFFKELIVKSFQNIGTVINSHKDLWNTLQQLIYDFYAAGKQAFEDLKPFIEWMFETGLPGIVDGFLNILQPLDNVIQSMNNLGLSGPILIGLAGAMMLYSFASANASTIIKIFTGLQDLFNAVMAEGSLGMKIITAAQWLWNAAMDANPIGVICTLVGLLIAGLVILATHWTKVKKGALDALNSIIDKINHVIGLLNKIPGVKIGIISKFDTSDIPDDNKGPSNVPTNNNPFNSYSGVGSNLVGNSSTYNPWLDGNTPLITDPWGNNNPSPINPTLGLNNQMPFMPGSPAFGTNPMSYMMPQSNTITNHVTNNLNQTTHIYGNNDASGTASNIQDGAQDLIRSMQGVFI